MTDKNAPSAPVTRRAKPNAPETPVDATPDFPSSRSFFEDTNVLESLRTSEYGFEGGLFEFVDNAIESGAPHVWAGIKTEEKTSTDKNGKKTKTEIVSEVYVVDDGCGMNPKTLHNSLAIGATMRASRRGQSLGIGRFGVGLPLGSISLARRVDVYSRESQNQPFLHTYLDLDEIRAGEQRDIPAPVPAEPPAELAALLQDSSGTIVHLTKCDRLQSDPIKPDKLRRASEVEAGVMNELGRVYRKFIEGGRQIFWNKQRVLLHDPLFVSGPTIFDQPSLDLRAREVDPIVIPLEIPGKPGETADVVVRLSLLPEEWRPEQGAGGWKSNKERHIDDNEGISILRADREVYYGRLPYLLGGGSGQVAYERIDRWWGCEISFPPELDEYFHVRYIKRGAEPVPSLRDKLRERIWLTIKNFRSEIQAVFRKNAPSPFEEQEQPFADAERAFAKASGVLPSGKLGRDVDPEQAQEALEEVASNADVGKGEPKVMEERRKKHLERLQAMPVSIVPVNWPGGSFFESVHAGGKIIVSLNTAHPFYKEVFYPLCGSVEGLTEESDAHMGASTPEQRFARNAMMLILMSFAQAEAFFPKEDQQELINSLRAQWSIALATATKELVKVTGGLGGRE
ncbi:ATP-binding protein [Deinococcus yavapaiensis]|uniref:Histidine kinase/DNA gyrase B/HSP90-like ATPase n=1 Tax=Deinococcus yavapaiensis KR-236 TaxID=694435 RepID=A0A318SN57_9DEIO|nr:ATP-binding protein [Deinococcus yavapaiensis]PYE54089.1 histidine kinase/DNA gyrase B/HSP90-like ATPase [Deinococcus yavapaiensis KR-236]